MDHDWEPSSGAVACGPSPATLKINEIAPLLDPTNDSCRQPPVPRDDHGLGALAGSRQPLVSQSPCGRRGAPDLRPQRPERCHHGIVARSPPNTPAIAVAPLNPAEA